jgi:hypothetical protein
MKKLPTETMSKRLAYVEERLRRRSTWDLFPEVSDQQLLRRQEQANYTLLIFNGTNLMMWGIKALFRSRDGFAPESLIAAGMVLWMFYIGYSLVRLRWALEAFEQFGPQSVADLRQKIDEQAAPCNPYQPPCFDDLP